jgi:ABC-type multidrug transport system ATPase subunit
VVLTGLLNILSQRVKNYSGDVTVNGKKSNTNLGGLMAYVRQDDVLLGDLTVFETLKYAAWLRIPQSVGLKKKKQRVNEVLTELSLEGCKNTKVGKPGLSKGISGGERKRLAIAIELLTQPSILFLDEPTTGLDATAALHLMEVLKKVSLAGRSVILTIHQPRSNIFQLFDRLLLLTRGYSVYFGDAQSATDHFARLGWPMPLHYNPADFLLDLISVRTADINGTAAVNEQDVQRVETIIQSYKTSADNTQLELPQELKELELKSYTGYQSYWIVQWFVIFLRSYVLIRRSTILTVVRAIQTIILAVLVGLIFLRLGYDQRDVQNRTGVLFFVMINQMMNSLFSGLLLFIDEKPVYLRERSARAYHVSSYFLGKITSELPQLIYPIIFGIIVYWMTGLNDSFDNFLVFLLILLVGSYCALSFGEFISASVPTFHIAQVLGQVAMIICLLFSGFFVNVDTIPNYFIWVSNLLMILL